MNNLQNNNMKTSGKHYVEFTVLTIIFLSYYYLLTIH